LYSQFEDLTNQVNKKASSASLNTLAEKTEQQFKDLASIYATISDIDASNKESKLAKTLDSYYTKEATDDKFVTKESLKGDSLDDIFAFVTKSQYDTD